MPVRPVRGKSSPSRRKAGLAGSSHVSLPSEFPSAKKGINSFIEFLRNFQFHKLKLYKQNEIDEGVYTFFRGGLADSDATSDATLVARRGYLRGS